MNLKQRQLDDLLTSSTSSTPTSSDQIGTSNTLTSLDDDKLKEIIYAEYQKRGIDLDDISVMSTTSLVVQDAIAKTERLAEILEQQKRESSILTAQKNTTLYSNLVQHTDEIRLSNPSRLEVFVKIGFDEIEKYGTLIGNNTWEFKYTFDNIIVLDSLEFIPEYEATFVLTKTNTKNELQVYYELEDGVVTIPVQRAFDYNYSIYYGIFKLPFIQLHIEKQERTFSKAQLERFIITTSYPIHDFIMAYKDINMSTPISVDARLYFTRDTTNFMRYRIHANNKISLEYANSISGFKPSSGGKLSITLLTTTGSNIKFRGDAVIRKSTPSNLQIEYDCVGEEYISTGGVVTSSDKEFIRNYILKLKGTRLRIDTETDLTTYLSTYEGSSSFVSKLIISDIKRMFNVYSKLSFEDNKNEFIIPTTTGDVEIDLKTQTEVIIDSSKYYNFDNLVIDCTSSPLGDIYTSGITSTPTFQYGIPFNLSYDVTENFLRCLMNDSYLTPYPTYVKTNHTNVDIPTRFVNTNLRIANMYDEELGERVFKIRTDIRSDNLEYPISKETMGAYLEFIDSENDSVRVNLSNIIPHDENNKFTLEFELNSDAKLYGRFLKIKADKLNNLNVWENGDYYIDFRQVETILSLFCSVNKGTEDMPLMENIPVTDYICDLSIFEDVTEHLQLQTTVNSDGNLIISKAPMVEHVFLSSWRNRDRINAELLEIFSFFKNEIYVDNTYSKNTYTIRDRQESLFSLAIKFVKSHGKSKFINISNGLPLNNLQIKPTLNYRLFDSLFDTNTISSEFNEVFSNHNFVSEDLHMNNIVSDILSNYQEQISILQFISIGDEYTNIEHLLKQEIIITNNDDIPEVLSLRPKFNEDLDIYQYDVTYNII